MRPLLAEGFSWVTPYNKKPQRVQCADKRRRQSDGLELFEKYFHNGYFCTGETSFICDAVYAKCPVYISPSPNDAESLLNALFCEYYELGVDIGKVDNKRYALRRLDNLPSLPEITLSIQRYPKLHELLEL